LPALRGTCPLRRLIAMLVKAEQDSILRLGARIGEGRTATVYRSLWRGRKVAVKELTGHGEGVSKKDQVSFTREVSILHALRHKNVVRLYGFSDTPDALHLILEYCEGGDVFEYVHQSGRKICLKRKIDILSDMSQAMEYLHGHNPRIIHRDLKTLNLFFTKKNHLKSVVKVGDFGSARTIGSEAEPSVGEMTKCVGTSLWMAPEARTGHYDQRVDVFSFAMTMFEVLCQEMPFEHEDPVSVPALVSKGARPCLQAVPPDVPDTLSELMVQCWTHNPIGRPGFTELTKHCIDASMAVARG